MGGGFLVLVLLVGGGGGPRLLAGAGKLGRPRKGGGGLDELTGHRDFGTRFGENPGGIGHDSLGTLGFGTQGQFGAGEKRDGGRGGTHNPPLYSQGLGGGEGRD